jgi:hypothetical protein
MEWLDLSVWCRAKSNMQKMHIAYSDKPAAISILETTDDIFS